MNLFNTIKQANRINPINSIFTGFIVNTIADILSMFGLPQILYLLIRILGWYYIFNGFGRINKRGLKCQMKGLTQFLLYFYIVQVIIMIIRGYLIDYSFPWTSFPSMINYHFFFGMYWLAYILPVTAFIPIKYYNFRLFLKIAYWFAFIGIIISILNIRNVITQATLMSTDGDGIYGYGAQYAAVFITFAFSVFCHKYVPPKEWKVYILSLFVSVVICAIAARRGTSAILLTMLLMSLYYYLQTVYKGKTIISITFILLLIIVGYYLFSNSSAFDYIQSRGMEDTRTAVDQALLNSMSDIEKIFGKGLNGRYFYQVGRFSNGWRYGSETGFYTIVLRGGYLMAFTYILLLGIPALKGIFNSKNVLCKGGGCYIIISLLDLYPFGALSFSLNFFIIWLLLVLVQRKEIRKMNDAQIYQLFFR